MEGGLELTETNQATQTNSSSFSFSCGVIVGVCVVLLLLSCLVFFSANGDKSLAKQGRQGA